MEEELVIEDRVIGKFRGDQPGKLFLCVAGIHSNERTGIIALQRVFASLEEHKPSFAGRMIAVAGNLTAIKENTRYIDIDLNRIWNKEQIDEINKTELEDLDCNEHREMKALMKQLDTFTFVDTPRNIVFVDLHNTSAAEGMFTFTFEGETNYEVASALHIPIITGLDKSLQGTAVEFFAKRGYCSLAFEGGPLGDPKSIDIHEAGIWMLLEASGCMAKDNIPNYESHKELMRSSTGDAPEVVDLVYVHNIKEEDNFKMNPGYRNFQRIEEGEVLGQDVNGDVKASHAGYIMMPLYQKQGDEGFFITQDPQGN